MKTLPGDVRWRSAPILYFSGNFSREKRAEHHLFANGLRHRCYTFAILDSKSRSYEARYQRYLNNTVRWGGDYILDSGAFSFHRGTLKDSRSAFQQRYVDYVLSVKVKPDWYITFDYTKDASLIYRVTAELNGAGLKPVPVFHGDSTDQYLERYAGDGHRLLCLGKREGLQGEALYRYYAHCFEAGQRLGLQYHGLMVTGSNLFRFPWYSVDSATWIKAASNKSLLIFDRQRWVIKACDVRAWLPDQLYGIPPDALRTDWLARATYNIRVLEEAIAFTGKRRR